jgi:hypothetical protein
MMRRIEITNKEEILRRLREEKESGTKLRLTCLLQAGKPQFDRESQHRGRGSL